jgi:hypothetical protein
MSHPLNRYQDYERETNQDAYEYEKRCFEREETYWNNISRENERDYFVEQEADHE